MDSGMVKKERGAKDVSEKKKTGKENVWKSGGEEEKIGIAARPRYNQHGGVDRALHGTCKSPTHMRLTFVAMNG
jgi:hypothetical protein